MATKDAADAPVAGRSRVFRSVTGIFGDTYSLVFGGIHALPIEDTWAAAGDDIAGAWRTVGGDLWEAVDAHRPELAANAGE